MNMNLLLAPVLVELAALVSACMLKHCHNKMYRHAVSQLLMAECVLSILLAAAMDVYADLELNYARVNSGAVGSVPLGTSTPQPGVGRWECGVKR